MPAKKQDDPQVVSVRRPHELVRFEVEAVDIVENRPKSLPLEYLRLVHIRVSSRYRAECKWRGQVTPVAIRPRPCHKSPMPDRVIITKRKIYRLPGDQQGQPVEEAWPNANIPARLKGAKIYQTEDGPVVAVPDPEGEI
jgi:hypothetical protein